MRIAGVRLANGAVRWVDAGEQGVRPLDEATIRAGNAEESGQVFVTPEQFLSPPDRLDGVLHSSAPPPPPENGCRDLPGADLPPLGSMVSVPAGSGRVQAVDPVGRRITLQVEGADELEIALEDADDGG